MLDLEYELKGICRRNRDGSHMTQAQREQRLRQAARDLERLGYKHMRASSLKPKHVEALVGDWHARGLSQGTIKNRMADLRWWAEKVGKSAAVAGSNDHYGIERRVYVTNDSKARELPADALERVGDEHIRMSLRLQAAFGLRREESIKFIPSYADRGDHLALKASWCKGGRAREVPIRTPEQRALMDRARALAGKGSLIPSERRYIDQRKRYERECVRAGLDRMHGLRHAYAQARYREITGWDAPAAGGLSARELTDEQRTADRAARLDISRGSTKQARMDCRTPPRPWLALPSMRLMTSFARSTPRVSFTARRSPAPLSSWTHYAEMTSRPISRLSEDGHESRGLGLALETLSGTTHRRVRPSAEARED